MKNIGHVLFFLFLPIVIFAQTLTGGGEANPNLQTHKQSLEEWQKLRFGMFIHWGPVSLRGTEIGWSRGREVPFEEYDQLYKEFNPVLFDAKEWISIAKAAGMKYFILVTKHHDGFTLWDSEYTDYDIMNSPYKRDIVKELSDECKKQGLLFGTYYSVLDWYHPDYPVKFRGNVLKETHDMDSYVRYMKNQLTELVTKYDTRILWFDGEWEEPWTHQMGMDLYAWARYLDNELLINNRVDKGRRGMEGTSKSDIYAGDFETPEQQIGSYNTKTPWETCMTICRQWAWKPNDKLKSLKECIHTLVRTAGGDGNLLLNIGPMLDGRFEQRQIDRLKEIGQWLQTYGETIYETRGGPVMPGSWGVTTHKKNTVYVHVLNFDENVIVLPGLENVQSVNRFDNNAKIIYEQTKMGLLLELPDIDPNTIDLVLKVNLDK